MLKLFLTELRYRWVIHVLVVIVMACVMAILVIQTSFNSSAETRISELSHKLGRNMIVLPAGADLESFYRMRYGPGDMPDDYGDRVKATSLGAHVQLVDPRLYGNVNINGSDVILVGQRIDYRSMGIASDAIAAVSRGAAQALGVGLNDTITVNNTVLNVIMVVDPPPKGMDMAVFVPLTAAQRIMNRPGRINALYMGGCWCELDIAAFAGEVEKMLPGTMAITIDGMAKAQTEIVGVMERYSVIVWIAGSLLAVGTIVFLILYTLHKGGREIGLLMSIGLSPGCIAAKHIVVSVVTAAAGAVLGYVLSMPFLSWFGERFLRIRLDPSWDLLPYFMAVSLAVAFIASSFPSWYVSRLDPTKLLREE